MELHNHSTHLDVALCLPQSTPIPGFIPPAANMEVLLSKVRVYRAPDNSNWMTLCLTSVLTGGQVTQQAMNYAIKTGITITSGYAIRQCGRLLKVRAGT